MDCDKFYGYTLTVPYPLQGFTSYHHYSAWCKENNVFPYTFKVQQVPCEKETHIIITGIATVL